MSLTTRSLRLHLLSVLGAPLPGAKVTLQLSAYQADGTDIVPLVWALPEDSAVPGDYVGPIWPNTRGDGGTHYDLLVQANGQVLLTQVVTVVAGAAQAVLKARINAAPYPAVYAAEVVVGVANVFADAAGESASRAQAAVDSVNQVVEDYETVGAAASLATQKAAVATDRAAFADARAAAAEVSRQGAAAALSGAVAAGENVGDFLTKADADAAMASQPNNKSCTVSADGLNNGFYVKRAGVLNLESRDTLQAVATRNWQFKGFGEWKLALYEQLTPTTVRFAWGVDRSGEMYGRLRQDTEVGTELLINRLVPAGVGPLMQLQNGSIALPGGTYIGDSRFRLLTNEDYGAAIVGDAGGVLKATDIAIDRGGLFKDEVIKRVTARLDPADLGAAFVARLPVSERYTAQVTGSTPNRKLFVALKNNGTRRLVTASGDPRAAYIVENTYVFWTDSSGIEWFVPCAGGTPQWVYPYGGVGVGDSLTLSDGTNWPALIGTTLGIPWANIALGGRASSDAATLQGGLVPTLTVAGGSIPANGSVGVTISPVDAWRRFSGTGNYNYVGVVAGVPGTLAHDIAADTWTFTRTNAGALTAAPAGTPFLISTPTYDNRIQTHFAGYNNRYSTGTISTVIRDYALMDANIKTYHKWALKFGQINSANEPIGSAGLAEVLSVNATLAATYGPRYFDFRSWAINDALNEAGIPWTSDDLADKANGIVPRSARIPGPPLDPVHYVPAVYAAIAPKVISLMTNLGWV